jgi:alpha-tubulin suppressor-like RCC1 family protein
VFFVCPHYTKEMNVARRIVGGEVVRQAAAAMKRRTATTTSRRRLFLSPFSSRRIVGHVYAGQHGGRRSLAVMVMGHGWTGALGTGRLDQYIAGHDDADYYYYEDHYNDDHEDDPSSSSSSSSSNHMLPVTIYDSKDTTGQRPSSGSSSIRSSSIRMARPGWGHTVVVTHDHKVLLTGRAHDFQNLLRLHRMPEWLRRQIAKSQQQQQTSQASSSSSSSSSRSYMDRLLDVFLQNDGASGGESSAATRSSSSSDWMMQRDWQVAADMSLLTSLTEISDKYVSSSEPIVAVACSAGLTALVSGSSRSSSNNSGDSGGGFVYTFGINSFGQCGVGILSSNVWQPTRVVTTSRQIQKASRNMLGTTAAATATATATTSQIGFNDHHNDSIDENSGSSIVNRQSPSLSSPLNLYDNDNDDMVEEEQQDKHQYLRNITSVALGLQHGVCLNESGQVYCFGKGDRGQLGLGKFVPYSPTAELVQQYCILQPQPLPNQGDDDDDDDNGSYSYSSSNDPHNPKPIYKPLGPVQQVAAGLLHTAALTRDDNQVLLWGKNVLPPLPVDANSGKVASDANAPCLLQFPKTENDANINKRVLQIACGSHHTAMLLEDGSVYAVGLASGTSSNSGGKIPIFEPVLLIPPGLVEMPVRQFAAHMDRTTIVGASGQQVLQVQLSQSMPTTPKRDDDEGSLSSSRLLWGDDEALSSCSASHFTPAWVNRLLEHDPNVRVQEVHRGWLHTVIVTDDPNSNDEGTIKKINHDNDKTTV